MLSKRIASLLRMSWKDRLATARYFCRRGLARLPYAPLPIRIQLAPGETLRFWWSYVSPFFDPSRSFLDYWGNDLHDLRLLWKLLKPGMVFLDIGAHHGIFSLVAAKRVGPEGFTASFEPSPRERRRLRWHLRCNGFRSARVESLAVGASSSVTDFFQVVSGDDTRGGLRPPQSSDATIRVPIKTIALDHYLLESSLNRVDLIKLDVEGAEMDVLRGATRVLTVLRPLILCEVLDATTLAWGYPARDIISFLQQHDFAWFDVLPDGSLAPHQIRDSYPDVRNYLAIPREKVITG